MERKKERWKERKKGGQGDEPAAEGVELWRLLLVKISKLACKERMHALVLVKQGEVEEVAGSKAVDCLWWVHAQIGGLVLVVAHAGNLVQVVVAKLGCGAILSTEAFLAFPKSQRWRQRQAQTNTRT